MLLNITYQSEYMLSLISLNLPMLHPNYIQHSLLSNT